MRRIFFYGFILACLILGAGVIGAWSLLHVTQNQPVGGQKGDLELSMTADKAVIFAGEIIDFVFILKNKGDENVTFWMGPPFFDVYLYDLNGALVARWTEGRAFAAYIEKITLEPGEAFSKTIQWNLYSFHHETGGFIPVEPGQCRISGVWLGEARVETSEITVTVSVKHEDKLCAVIEDVNGDRLDVETTSDHVWSVLVEMYQNGIEMWVGGVVERYNNKWGFRFKPETITVAEVTAEGLQATIRDISANVDYWLDVGYAYVFAKVTDYSMGVKMQVFAQLSSDIVARGDDVTVSAIVKDDAGKPIEGVLLSCSLFPVSFRR